jgi:hypothetical protein
MKPPIRPTEANAPIDLNLFDMMICFAFMPLTSARHLDLSSALNGLDAESAGHALSRGLQM